jgi:hypothetical protein
MCVLIKKSNNFTMSTEVINGKKFMRRFDSGDVLLRRRCVSRSFVWRRFVEVTLCRRNVLYAS